MPAERRPEPVCFFCDVTPLLEPAWTGIPMVCAELAHAFHKHFGERLLFMARDRVLRTDAVLRALAARDGGSIHAALPDAAPLAGYGVVGLIQRSVAFYPSVKPSRAAFAHQFGVLHDISTLIVPEFHSVANIRHHLEGLERDIADNTLTFCVSAATRDDVHAYLGTPLDRLHVVLNGCGWREQVSQPTEDAPPVRRSRPYIVVLGTLEERKNVRRVLKMVARRPDLLDRHDLVFIGTKATHAADVPLPDLGSDRVVHVGYVSEFEKHALLRGAALSLYPSLFEGFGLPILETLSVGTPCVASLTSGHREAGGDACLYFDPLSVDDMARQILAVLALSPAERKALCARGRSHAAGLTWDRTAAEMLRAMAPYLEQNPHADDRPRQLPGQGAGDQPAHDVRPA